MGDRERLVETIRAELDPSCEGIVRECYRQVSEVIRAAPVGMFADEVATERAALYHCLCNCAQIIDVVKQEWLAENAWSDWGQSVRDQITTNLRSLAEQPRSEGSSDLCPQCGRKRCGCTFSLTDRGGK